MGNMYGYIRVSTAEQNEARQYLELVKLGIKEENVFIDKFSGKDFNRPEYQRLRQKLRAGDLMVVKSIDRLGRNYAGILEEWRYITRVVKADIRIVDMPLLDTHANKDLVGTLISDIVLQLLSYVAQTEREFIRQRQAEGIAAARVRGVHLGRVASAYPNGFFEVLNEQEKGAISRAQAAAQLALTMNQYDWLKRRSRLPKHTAPQAVDIFEPSAYHEK